jgi:hypothetical protein
MNNPNKVQSSDATKLGGRFTLPGTSMTLSTGHVISKRTKPNERGNEHI